MRVVERARGLADPPERARRRLRAFGEDVVQRPARQVLHDDERPAPPHADVVDRDRVRLTGEPRRRARLTLEAVAELGVVGAAVVQELDRNDAAQLRVRRLDHLAHAAAGDAHRIAVARRQQADAGPRAVEPNRRIHVAVLRDAAPPSRHLVKTPAGGVLARPRVRRL